MKLEVFKIFVGYEPESSIKEEDWVGSVEGFAINDKVYADKDIEDRWKYKTCSLEAYRAFEIEHEPKNIKLFSWLVHHHFNALTSKIVNRADIENKIKIFLEVE